jgi:hypothetical protein
MRNFRTRIFMGLGTARAHHPLSHKSKTIGAMLLGSAAVLGLWVTPGLADGVNCQHVGGGVLTNFIDASDTDGIAIGDLRGSVGVAVLGINGSVYHVHHHWVTETGDNIFLDHDPNVPRPSRIELSQRGQHNGRNRPVRRSDRQSRRLGRG